MHVYMKANRNIIYIYADIYYIYTHLYICVHLCIHTHTCMHTCIHTYTCVCLYLSYQCFNVPWHCARSYLQAIFVKQE